MFICHRCNNYITLNKNKNFFKFQNQYDNKQLEIIFLKCDKCNAKYLLKLEDNKVFSDMKEIISINGIKQLPKSWLY